MAKKIQTVEVGGREIRLSNVDKVLYPATGTTKGEVIGYYSEIASTMLPHCRDRAATRKRWPDGVGEDGSGAFFFQKDIGDSAPEWVATGEIEHKSHTNDYPLVNDEATLVWLAQLASLEIHVPQWRFDREGQSKHPDRLVLDLDPGPGVSIRECADVAFLVRDLLRDMGLEAVPVTSGSKGIHVYAGLDGSTTSEQASRVARELARSLEADHPNDITSSMKKSLREGKVFIDWSQNNASKTTIAPYSLRGRTQPWVAAPRSWRELASPHLRQLGFRDVLDRVAKRGDPMLSLASSSGDPAADRVHERLDTYRGMRDASVTPEPVPASGATLEAPEHDSTLKFVIQRHDARRLHYDFRLEHNGVFVSWALPKGVPTDPKKNHLAVPTEDHPMEYRHFAGTIPRGQYGAGEVEIWDSGTVEIEKWRDDEVIAVLTGQPDGGLGDTRRYALFRTGTGKSGKDKPNWMIHLMAPKKADSVADAASREGAKRGPKPRDPTAEKRRSTGSRQSRRAEKPAAARGVKRLSPMLATRGTPADLRGLDPETWAFEMKWDGMRALAAVDERSSDAESSLALSSRSGVDVTATYPELKSITEVLNAEQAVLDGEIVALVDGAPSFGRLQQRMGLTGEREVERARRTAPVSYFVFDLLELNGSDCRNLTYRQRRELLESVVEHHAGRSVALPDIVEESVQEAMETSRRLNLEGVIAKQWESVYRTGARSSSWLKFPLIETAEAVVIGWRRSESDARGLASLLLATRNDGELTYAGRVGTGFSLAERRSIRRQLANLSRKTPAIEAPVNVRRDAHWVDPVLVGEVSYGGITDEGRFRHPVWRGWRPDKSIDDL